MPNTANSFTHMPIHTNESLSPNSQIAANKAVTPSESSSFSSVEKLHDHTWFSYQIDGRTQFRVTTELGSNRKWKVDARDWYWDKAGEWRRSKTGGCFRAPYGLDAAKAVLAATRALRAHGAPFDDGGEQ